MVRCTLCVTRQRFEMSLQLLLSMLLPVFIVGLLGSVHCLGMCGGIVSAFSVGRGSRAKGVVPIAAVTRVTGSAAATFAPARSLLSDAVVTLAYNAGRLSSYAVAGALVGGMAQSLRAVGSLAAVQSAGYWAANLMLVALGLYLMGLWRGLAQLEAMGRPLWRRIQPFTTRLLPVDSPSKAFVLGALWGWVPCAMVYSVLLTAAMSGSAAKGAAIMLVFGLGTLPMLLGLMTLGSGLHKLLRLQRVRLAAGLVVMVFGLIGLARSVEGMMPAWLEQICTAPLHGGQP